MRVNLLPWREKARRAQRHTFMVHSGLVVLGVVLMVSAVNAVQQHWLTEQQARNQRLTAGVNDFRATLQAFKREDKKRAALQSRLQLVNALQQQRNNVTALLNFIPTVMPEGAYLSRLAQQKGRVTVEGWVTSNAEMASLLAALEQSTLATDVDIDTVITESGSQRANKRFTLSFRLTDYVTPQLPKPKGVQL